MLSHNNHRVVVVGASSLPDQIDPAFLLRFDLKLRVRGPEAHERFLLLRHLVQDTYTSVDPEFLEIFDRHGCKIDEFTGAEIRSAMVGAVTLAESELEETKQWVR